MVMVKTETDLSFWLDGEGFKVFVGEEESPAATLDLLEMVRDEIMMYAVPATAKSLDDVKELHDEDDGILQLHETLAKATEMVFQALKKKTK